MHFKRTDNFFVVGTVEECKTKRTRIVVKARQMLEDFLAKNFLALIGDVEHHAFRAVSIAFGMTYDAFVLFERNQPVIDCRRANLSPAVEFPITNFRDDVVTTALVFQDEAEQYKIVTVHLNSLILLLFQVGIIDLIENYIFFKKKIVYCKKIKKKLHFIVKNPILKAFWAAIDIFSLYF